MNVAREDFVFPYHPMKELPPQTNKLNAILVLILYLHGCVLEQRSRLEKVSIYNSKYLFLLHSTNHVSYIVRMYPN